MMNPLILPPSNWWHTKSSENGVAMSSLVLHNYTIDTKHVHINGYYTCVPHEFLCENDTGALKSSAKDRSGSRPSRFPGHFGWPSSLGGNGEFTAGIEMEAKSRGKKMGNFYWVDDVFPIIIPIIISIKCIGNIIQVLGIYDVMIILEYSLFSVWDSDRDACNCNCNML